MTQRDPVPGYGSHRGESFARYYLRNVAVNEGCGCAEGLLLRDRGLATADADDADGRPPRRGLLTALRRKLTAWRGTARAPR